MNTKRQPRESRSRALRRERLRQEYRPPHIKVLFVGESPPASGRFFYKADSGLYRAVKHTFVGVFPDLKNANFLESFRDWGAYLVDLCGRPVDRLDTKGRKAVCIKGEARLSRMIRQLRPAAMVTLVRSIEPNVQRAQERANWKGPHVELPYPGRWQRHRIEFDKKLVRFLRQLESDRSRTLADHGWILEKTV